MKRTPQPDFTHLLSLSGPHGTFEHAEFTEARVEHGYCTDDVARVLLVTSRESEPSFEVGELARKSLSFLSDAQGLDGRIKNRRAESGAWLGPRTNEDCWGRSIWSFGTAIARSSDEDLVFEARRLFERGIMTRSHWPRAMAFATFGAAEVLLGAPTHEGALDLIVAAAKLLDRPEPVRGWHWSEDRLAYANAALPEAMMVAGSIVGNDRLVEMGLRQLKWLLDMSSLDGHLSVTPAQGRGPDSTREKFDQQPIEAAALSEACIRASEVTGDAEWIKGHELAVQWFLGDNDVASPMFDADSGGGYDGLTARGPNRNQGAESTIALLTTLQQARHFELAL